MPTRLNKFLAERGIASRRGADALIEAGRVTVNGRTAEAGLSVGPEDVVLLDGKPLQAERERKVYFALNKPKGVLSSVKDPHHDATVRVMLGGIKERIYPVGRLDKDSKGLMILTNDGELARRVTHPSCGIKKVYRVRFHMPVSDETVLRFTKGIALEEDGLVRAESIRVDSKNPRRATITLAEGKKRQIRRMAEACGLKVVALQRVAIGPVRLGDLAEGKHRRLMVSEIRALKGGEKSGRGRDRKTSHRN